MDQIPPPPWSAGEKAWRKPFQPGVSGPHLRHHEVKPPTACGAGFQPAIECFSTDCRRSVVTGRLETGPTIRTRAAWTNSLRSIQWQLQPSNQPKEPPYESSNLSDIGSAPLPGNTRPGGPTFQAIRHRHEESGVRHGRHSRPGLRLRHRRIRQGRRRRHRRDQGRQGGAVRHGMDDPKGIVAFQKWLFVADNKRVCEST